MQTVDTYLHDPEFVNPDRPLHGAGRDLVRPSPYPQFDPSATMGVGAELTVAEGLFRESPFHPPRNQAPEWSDEGGTVCGVTSFPGGTGGVMDCSAMAKLNEDMQIMRPVV